VNPRGFGVHLYEGASARGTHADRLRVTKANLVPREFADACAMLSKRISTVAARLRLLSGASITKRPMSGLALGKRECRFGQPRFPPRQRNSALRCARK
jgi:hypothetical protein